MVSIDLFSLLISVFLLEGCRRRNTSSKTQDTLFMHLSGARPPKLIDFQWQQGRDIEVVFSTRRYSQEPPPLLQPVLRDSLSQLVLS